MNISPLASTPFPCGYFDDRDSTYEHFLLWETSPEEKQALLDMGYRAFGKYTFRPMCHGCYRCVPIRVPISAFRPSKSQRRVWKKGGEIRVVVDQPHYHESKFALYKEHGKRFPKKEQAYAEEDFRFSFYDPDVPALEFTYFWNDRLVAVGLVLETPYSLSSVYFFYHPDASHLSLGTFSVLKELEYGATHGKAYLYLGYYIHLNRYMRYKADFRPCEVLGADGQWHLFRDERGLFLQEEEAVKFERFPTPLSRFIAAAKNREPEA